MTTFPMMASDRVDRMIERVDRERARLLLARPQPVGWAARYSVLGGKLTWLAKRYDRERGREFAARWSAGAVIAEPKGSPAPATADLQVAAYRNAATEADR